MMTRMNPLLARLHPYPFERLRALTADITPPPAFRPIGLGIGEPRHATPALIEEALVAGDHEAMAVRQLEQRAPFFERHHGTGRVARRADVQQLGAGPGGSVDLRPVGGEVA